MLADLARLAWLGIVALVLLRAFGAGRVGVRRDPAARIAHLSRAILVVVILVNLLARLHLFNAATFLLAWMAWPAARWLKRSCWDPERAVRSAVRRLVLELVRRVEQPTVRGWMMQRNRRATRRLGAALRLTRIRLEALRGLALVTAAAAIAIVAAAIELRIMPVLGEPRLSHPDLYAALLSAREAASNVPAGAIGGLGAAAAVLSAVGAIDAIHVIRLLVPLVSIALVLTGALLVRRLTGSGAGAIVTLAALTIPWTSGNLEAGLLCVVLAALALTTRTRASGAGAVAAMLAAVAVLSGGVEPAARLAAVPVVLGIAAGVAFAAAARAARRLASVRLDLVAAPAACLACVMLMPQAPRAMYLEHRVAQEKVLEIADDRPRGRWLIVAPVEQLAETYGRGWYEDSAGFVDRYAAHAGDPGFRFTYSVDEVFVFVEMRPFKTFQSEAADVPFATLTDATYRHYRSTAGRASLQARLLSLCRAYARSHDGVSIYYEDDDLAIYRVRVDG